MNHQPIIRLFSCLFLVGGVAFSTTLKAQSVDSFSYSLGVLVGTNLSQQGLDEIDTQSFLEGLSDKISNSDLKIDANQANQVVQSYMQKKQEAQYADKLADNAAWLAENAKKPGVTTLESGLQYEVMQAGDGPSPGPTDKVTTHYHGTLIDGTVFDSSVDRGQPASFGVNQVIKGWTEALQLMKVGDKWRLYVPSDLAYGARGAGQNIPPHTPLIFEVELISID